MVGAADRAQANTPPVITVIANQTLNEDASTPTIAFSIGDAETPATSLTLTATTNNPALLLVSRIVFGGSGTSRTVKITPNPNRFGTANVRVRVDDPDSGTSSVLFSLTVNPVNDTPTITAIPDQTLSEDTPTAAIPFTIRDMETSVENLALVATTDNPALLPLSRIVFGGSGTGRTIAITPAANASGTARVRVRVSDGQGGTSSSLFTVTVHPVNDLPTITPIAGQTIPRNTSTPPIPFTIGDAETPASSLALVATTSNPTLIPAANIVFGGSGASRTVTLVPRTDQHGTCNVRIRVNDADGGTHSTLFTLTVNPGAPVITRHPEDQTVMIGDSARFTATASGTPAPILQWERSDDGENWIALPDATGTSYFVQAQDPDHGSLFRLKASSTYGTVASRPATLSVLPPSPAYGEELLYRRAGQNLAFSLAPSRSFPVAAYGLPLPIGTRIRVVIKGSVSPAGNLGVMLVNTGDGTASNPMLDEVSPIPVGPATDTSSPAVELIITRNPASDTDRMALVITSTDVNLECSLTQFEFWIEPTPPQPGARLMFARSHLTMEFSNIASSWMWTIRDWSGDVQPFPVGNPVPDTLTLVFHGTTAFNFPQGEQIYMQLIDNTHTATPTWIGPISKYWYLLDGIAAAPTGTPIRIDGDACESATYVSDNCFSSANILLILQDTNRNDMETQGRALRASRIQIWKKSHN